MRIKPNDQVAEKFATRVSASGADYTAGVDNPRVDQKAATVAAVDNYKAAMQKSLADDQFKKGVEGVPEGKWKAKARTIGAQRFPTGAAAAKGDFQKGVGPYLDTLRGLDLPERFPKGDPRNYDRSRKVGDTLNAQARGGAVA